MRASWTHRKTVLGCGACSPRSRATQNVRGRNRGSPIMSSGRRCMEPCGCARVGTDFSACISARFLRTHSTSGSFSLAGCFGLGFWTGLSDDRESALQVYVDRPLFRRGGGAGRASPDLTFVNCPRSGLGTSKAKHAFRMSPSVRLYLRATALTLFDQTSRCSSSRSKITSIAVPHPCLHHTILETEE
jgi:hypothetical protein